MAQDYKSEFKCNYLAIDNLVVVLIVATAADIAHVVLFRRVARAWESLAGPFQISRVLKLVNQSKGSLFQLVVS